MSRIDDELREVLRDRAERVVPPADPMSGIERRARSIRRRRRAAAVAGSALSVLLVAVALPVVAYQVRDWQQDHGGQAASRAVPEADQPAARLDEPAKAKGPAGAAGAGDASASTVEEFAASVPNPRPANYLDWPARGERPPRNLVAGTRENFAASFRPPPTEVTTQTLWAGRLGAKGDWVYVFQGWSAGDTEANLVAYRARPDGDSPKAIYRYPIYFRHAGLREDPPAARTDMSRVVMVAIPVDDRWALVVGGPDVHRIGYAPPSSDAFRPEAVNDGVALVRRSGPVREARELFQATDSSGAVLTPPDVAAQRRAQADRRPILSGWGID